MDRSDDVQGRLRQDLMELMLIPGLSGHEGRVRRSLVERLETLGVASRTDRLGNLIATLEGDAEAPSLMLFTHMDQLGFVVRRIEPEGFIRVERLGGVPERAMPSQAVRLCVRNGEDVRGVLANKSHHATQPDEKYKVVPYADMYIDVGLSSAAAVRARGVDIGTPIVYEPQAVALGDSCVAGTSVDDRAGCAVLLEVCRQLQKSSGPRPTVHLVFSVLEEFNLRGAMVAANALRPDIAIQIDLALTSDTPDLRGRGEVCLGGGPAMSLYNFHGRGTLNGTIPHPGLVDLFERIAAKKAITLQRSASVGILTDASYVQMVGEGVACIDLCFPCRYTHSSMEVCHLGDLEQLAALVAAGIAGVADQLSLDRDDYL